jgi:hypothetical protein
MNQLGETYAYGQGGVVGESTLAWTVEIGAPLDSPVQSGAEVHVVVEVAKARATDPTVGVIGARAELVRRAQAKAIELLMQTVFPGEEAGEPGFVAASYDVVVASENQLSASFYRELAKGAEQRCDEGFFARDLRFGPISRRDIHTEDHEFGVSCRDRQRGCSIRQRDTQIVGQVQSDRHAGRYEHASLASRWCVSHGVAAGLEAAGEKIGAGPVGRLGEDDEVVLSLPQPAKDRHSSNFAGCADIEGQHVGSRCRRRQRAQTGRCVKSCDRMGGVSERGHLIVRQRAALRAADGTDPTFARLVIFPARSDVF